MEWLLGQCVTVKNVVIIDWSFDYTYYVVI